MKNGTRIRDTRCMSFIIGMLMLSNLFIIGLFILHIWKVQEMDDHVQTMVIKLDSTLRTTVEKNKEKTYVLPNEKKDSTETEVRQH